VLIIAGLSFVAHVLVGTNYGYLRDELYLVAMSHHPDFGYVDVRDNEPRWWLAFGLVAGLAGTITTRYRSGGVIMIASSSIKS
jgi:hypothetical protein